MFQKKYEIIKNSPEVISWDKYEREINEEFAEMLLNDGDNEQCFQTFFERNPSLVPGALGMLGESGHYPYPGALITQPQIEGMRNRIPDFLWLSTNSGTFAPIFIEIEAPNKHLFTSTGKPSAVFTEALEQLTEWKAVMNKPTNIQMFFEKYSIPHWLRERKFKPFYVLIYGRRIEFENDKWLCNKRSELMREDEIIMSFDRISPNPKLKYMISAQISRGEYYVKNIPPTYKLGPNLADFHSIMKGFKEAVTKMEKTTDERKVFLKERFDYWQVFGQLKHQGIINSGDYE